MKARRLIWLVLLLGGSWANGQGLIPVWTAENGWQTQRDVFLRQGDSLAIAIPADMLLLQLQPLFPSYENLPNLARIDYLADILGEGPDTLRLRADRVGVQYLALWPGRELMSLDTVLEPTVVLRVRRDDSYLGYLTEMIGVPFVLPPRRFPDGGHQTDLGLGVDCAELAIYGRRRQGHKVPYVGPQGIYYYLRPIRPDSLFEGCVVHFGGQVSVLYRDLGRAGQLDAEDLLIQSYETWVRIVSWRESGWYRREWEGFMWR